MSDDATPRLALPYLAAAQAQKHVTHNAALSRLDGLVQTVVQSRSVAVEPAAPADGALYILPAGASGADWSGQGAGQAMRFEAGAWAALDPGVGWLAYVADENAVLVKTAAGWSDLGLALKTLANLALLGVGASADAKSPLTVRGPAALFTDAGAGLQLKVNKTATAQSGSVLFQTGYSGRAEVGLCGDDALHLRTSADGSTFVDAVVVAGGSVGVGVSAPTARLQVDGAVRVKALAKAALPAAAAQGAGAILFVSDEAGGATLVFSDGAAWRRVADGAVVS